MDTAKPSLEGTSEASVEKLLVRLVPGLTREWQGAPASEIDRIEVIAGRPLPPFYRWFLSRMGRSMGPMSYPTVDFSAQGVLAALTSGQIAAHPRYLLIGYEQDELMPLPYFYDLDQPIRGDALVVRMITPRDESHEQFETFREMLAWGELWTQRVERAPQQCTGTLRAGANVLAQLEPVMRRLGFEQPIETGAYAGLYEREDAALVCSGTPNDPPVVQTFGLGGRDAVTLAQILSELASELTVEVKPSAWKPPLPGDG
jgi:hypothetical protein